MRAYALVAAATVVYGLTGVAALHAKDFTGGLPEIIGLEDKCAQRFELHGHALADTNVFAGTHYGTNDPEYSVMGAVDGTDFGICIFNSAREIVAATRSHGDDIFFLFGDKEIKSGE